LSSHICVINDVYRLGYRIKKKIINRKRALVSFKNHVDVINITGYYQNLVVRRCQDIK